MLYNNSRKEVFGLPKTLSEKLGIKNAMTIYPVHAPESYRSLVDGLPEDVIIEDSFNDGDVLSFVHFFAHDPAQLFVEIPQLTKQLASNGVLWISWKKGVPQFNENHIRDFILNNDLVDVKVASVNSVWSALKCVRPLNKR